MAWLISILVLQLLSQILAYTPKPEKIEDNKSEVKIWVNGEIKTSNYKLLYEMSEVVDITCAYKYEENPKQFPISELNLYFYEKVSNNRRSEIQLQGSTSGKRGDEYYLRSLNTLNENYDGKTIYCIAVYCGVTGQGRYFNMAPSVEVTMEMIVTTEAPSTIEGNSVLESTTEGNSVNESTTEGNSVNESTTEGNSVNEICHWVFHVIGICAILFLCYKLWKKNKNPERLLHAATDGEINDNSGYVVMRGHPLKRENENLYASMTDINFKGPLE